MKKSRSFRDNILTIILILALLGIGYVWYSYLGSRPTGDGLVGSSIPPTQSEETTQFLALLSILEKTNIDTAFFSDPLFKSLGEKVELPPIPSVMGRPNPFAPFR